MRSNEINELASALAKAQADIKSAAKDGENPHFRSKYATLSSIWDAIREPLSKNGLSVTQVTAETEAGPLLETCLLHTSGQWLQSEMLLRPSKNDVQGFGSALTYARRYCLAAIVGVAPDDDDDGNAASTQSEQRPQRRPRENTPPAQPAPANGKPKQATKLYPGQQKFYDAVQDATGNYYNDPAHLVNAVGWPDFSSRDDIDARLSAAVDHAQDRQPEAGE